MGLVFEEFTEGAQWLTVRRTITEADIVTFTGFSWDYNPLHTDEEFARETPFGGRIAQGFCVASIVSGLVNCLGLLEGTGLALLEFVWRFKKAVKAQDTIHAEVAVKELRPTSDARRGIIVLALTVKNQHGEVVQEGRITSLVRRSEGAT